MSRPAQPVIDEDGLNVRRLDASIAAAVASEARYDLENAAKFRAVAQRVPTYDDFANIVKGAHIKPMTEDVTALQLARSGWAPHAGHATGRAKARQLQQNPSAGVARSVARCEPSDGDWQTMPGTAAAWHALWRSKDAGAAVRWHFLVHVVNYDVLPRMFSADIGSVLGDVLRVLTQQPTLAADDALRVVELLRQLAKCGRFSLALAFLPSSEHAAITRLIAVDLLAAGSGSAGQRQVQHGADSSACARELCAMYNIKVPE